MIHIICFDNIPKGFKFSQKRYAVLVSVSTNNNVFQNGEKSFEPDQAHLVMRFNEFRCFVDTLKYMVPKVEDVYVKFGGFCFMHNMNKEAFEKAEELLSYLFSQDYIIDEFSNNELLEKSSQRAAYDKLIFRKMLREKDMSILQYSLKKPYTLSKEELVEKFDKMTIAEFKKSDFCEKQDLIPTTVAGYEDYIKNLKVQPQK